MAGLIETAVLLAMGFLGGTVGAVAGGAGLFAFPALLYAGLNPVVASASSFVALTPSGLGAAYAARHRLDGKAARLAGILPTIVVGAGLGALMLTSIPVEAFSGLFPILLLLATALFAVAPRLQPATSLRRPGGNVFREHSLLFLAAVYGGFFGAGVGIVLLAALALTGWREIHQANAVKNLAITVASIGCIVIFVARGSIEWGETVLVMLGATLGGFFGGAVSQMIDELWIRRIVISVGLCLSAYYGLDVQGFRE